MRSAPRPRLRGRALLAVGVALLLGAPTPGARADDVEASRGPVALARALASAPAAQRPALERSLRAHGVAGIHALRQVMDQASPASARRLARLAGRMLAAWHATQVPEGMVYVPAGALVLPRAQAPRGPSSERATVAAFFMDRTEVTVGAWRAWIVRCEARRREDPSATVPRAPRVDLDDALPMTRVSWVEADRFARLHRGGRLPQVEEFERALRGSTHASWPWGREARVGAANVRDSGVGRLAPVGSFPSGASPFGVLDLVGNAAEWTATPVDASRPIHRQVPWIVGGSYVHRLEPDLTWRGRSRRLFVDGRTSRKPWLGFRVVRDVPDLPAPATD